jgi:F0F1-type ATP synthase assembly protein I
MNKRLMMVDVILVVSVGALIFVKQGNWADALTGFIAAVFVISIVNHVRHYITFKKFY